MDILSYPYPLHSINTSATGNDCLLYRLLMQAAVQAASILLWPRWGSLYEGQSLPEDRELSLWCPTKYHVPSDSQQIPRGTDLLAVAHRNTPENRRGVCIYANTIAVVSQVNKAHRTTNKEFYVVRFPDKDTARIIYKALTYIGPFSCMLDARASDPILIAL